MSILPILQYPDSRLYRKSLEVTDAKSPLTKKIISDMLETLANEENCAALAATQLDIENPPSIVVINDPGGTKNAFCLINPQILSKEGHEVAQEGCMSIFPDTINAEVERATNIKVKSMDMNGNHIEFEVEGFLARCIQHEHDHLEGILYIDHLKKAERETLEKQMIEEKLIEQKNEAQ